MKMKIVLMLLSAVVLSATASAALMTTSLAAPVVNGEDIANFVQERPTDMDKFFCLPGEAASKVMGQTFTTDSDGSILNALTYVIGADKHAGATKEYTIRVNTINKVDPGDPLTWLLTEIYSETATQDFEWDLGEYATWAFDTPLTLAGNTEYAIDLGMTSSTSSWMEGIPYLLYSRINEYDGGTRYMSGTGTPPGVGDASMSNVSGERVFHLDMTAIPEPATMCLLGLGGLLLRRKRWF